MCNSLKKKKQRKERNELLIQEGSDLNSNSKIVKTRGGGYGGSNPTKEPCNRRGQGHRPN